MKRSADSLLFSFFFFFSLYLFFLSLSLSPPSSCRNNAIYNLTQEKEEEENTGLLNSFQTVHWEQQLSKSGCGAYHSLSTLAAAAAATAALRMKTLDERWEKEKERRPRESHAAGNRLFVLPTQTHTKGNREENEVRDSEGDRSAAVTKRNRQKGARSNTCTTTIPPSRTLIDILNTYREDERPTQEFTHSAPPPP